MSLKDASFFNVQFRGCTPVFIDTLSFERFKQQPWIAYRQFCEHFVAPLFLMSAQGPEWNRFLRVALDGFDLNMTRKVLPWRKKLRPGALMHVVLHARSQKRHEGPGDHGVRHLTMTKQAILNVLDSLNSTIDGIRLPAARTEWEDYYENATHYSQEAEAFKQDIVERTVSEVRPSLVYDLGGNVGNYSRVATGKDIDCVCYDSDPLCVNRNYLVSRERQDRHMVPLVLDLANPSPEVGFNLQERLGFFERSKPDLVMALALIHHLRITANVPLTHLARFFARLGPMLLIEFVPKEDPMVQRLLSQRRDTFHDYDARTFENAFESHYCLETKAPVVGTSRALYLFKAR